MENVPAEMGHVVDVHILHCVLIDMDILQCMTDSMLTTYVGTYVRYTQTQLKKSYGEGFQYIYH